MPNDAEHRAIRRGNDRWRWWLVDNMTHVLSPECIAHMREQEYGELFDCKVRGASDLLNFYPWGDTGYNPVDESERLWAYLEQWYGDPRTVVTSVTKDQA